MYFLTTHPSALKPGTRPPKKPKPQGTRAATDRTLHQDACLLKQITGCTEAARSCLACTDPDLLYRREQPRTLMLKEDRFPSRGRCERLLQIDRRKRKNKGLNKYVEEEEVFN